MQDETLKFLNFLITDVENWDIPEYASSMVNLMESRTDLVRLLALVGTGQDRTSARVRVLIKRAMQKQRQAEEEARKAKERAEVADHYANNPLFGRF